MSTRRSWPKAIGFSLLGLVLWALTALFAWAGLGNTWYGWVSQDWPVAEGRIVATRIEEVRFNSRSDRRAIFGSDGGQIIRYRPVIEYQWQVDGGIYDRDRRNFSAAVAPEDTREAALAIIAPYEAGSSVEIHYDPKQPSRGILEPGPHWDGLSVSLIVALFLAAFAVVFSVIGFRKFTR